MTASVQQILNRFIDAWNAGERPDVDTHLRQAAKADREQLAEQILAWLAIASTPDYDSATRAEIEREPLLRAALEAAAQARQPWSARLPRLRERAGLGVREVASRLTALLGLEGQEQRTAQYLEQMERDELDARRLSRRLLDGLATVLGASRDDLAPGAGPLSGAGTAAPASAGQAFFRADEPPAQWVAENIDALSRAAVTSAPAPLDEVDRLFLGGPEG